MLKISYWPSNNNSERRVVEPVSSTFSGGRSSTTFSLSAEDAQKLFDDMVAAGMRPTKNN